MEGDQSWPIPQEAAPLQAKGAECLIGILVQFGLPPAWQMPGGASGDVARLQKKKDG